MNDDGLIDPIGTDEILINRSYVAELGKEICCI